jgi:hypothetical protein
MLIRPGVKLLVLAVAFLAFQVGPARADSIATIQLDASLIGGHEDPGGFNVFQTPTVFVSGQIFFDLTTGFIPVPPGAPPNAVVGINLTFSGPNGSLTQTTGGSGICEELGFLPGSFTCYFNGPGFTFQTNVVSAPLAVGSTFGACSVRTTLYPDGGVGLGSGICGETSNVDFLGTPGFVYSLENGPSSGTFTVTSISTPEPSALPLLGAGLAALLGLKLRRRSALRSS